MALDYLKKTRILCKSNILVSFCSFMYLSKIIVQIYQSPTVDTALYETAAILHFVCAKTFISAFAYTFM